MVSAVVPDDDMVMVWGCDSKDDDAAADDDGGNANDIGNDNGPGGRELLWGWGYAFIWGLDKITP